MMAGPIDTTNPPTLACPDQLGSVNTNPPTDPPVTPYTPPELCVGTWEITDPTLDECARNELNQQQSYVAESINISGVPLRVYLLKGVHQQGDGSVLSSGKIVASQSYPGHPSTGINGVTPWWSLPTGNSVTASGVFVGVDFGIKLINGTSEYQPQAPNFVDVGAIALTQSNNPGFFAQQVRVDITDGKCAVASVNAGTNTGNGAISTISLGSNASKGVATVVATSATQFTCYVTLVDGTVISIGTATVGTPFNSTYVNFLISGSSIPFVSGDMFSISVDYVWRRVGLFNVIQSPDPQILNLKSTYKAKAVRVVPTLFTGTDNWEVVSLDVIDAPPVDINNIQDLFLGENRDRDYNTTPIAIKAAYTPADSVTDLSKLGLSIIDQYTFTFAFADMITKLGRPLVVGDIVELLAELQYDQNLKPVRKFLEVTDTGWAASGFGPHAIPTVYRVNAQIAIPSQETRDIFGTMDTQKYLAPDAILSDNIGEQIDVTPLIVDEEIIKTAHDAVPERGSNDIRDIDSIVNRQALPLPNAKGNPKPLNNPSPSQGPNLYIEAGLPPHGEPYGEGFALPPVPGPADGEYFRLYYAPETKIAPRLFRFSAIKNRWLFLEQDKRAVSSSFKPSIQKILQSSTSQSLGKKL